MHRQWVCSIISWRFVEIVSPYEKFISKHICWFILDAGPVYPSLCKSCWWAALKLCLCHRDFGLWGTKRTRSMAFKKSTLWLDQSQVDWHPILCWWGCKWQQPIWRRLCVAVVLCYRCCIIFLPRSKGMYIEDITLWHKDMIFFSGSGNHLKRFLTISTKRCNQSEQVCLNPQTFPTLASEPLSQNVRFEQVFLFVTHKIRHKIHRHLAFLPLAKRV